jgi:hypothetical protein
VDRNRKDFLSIVEIQKFFKKKEEAEKAMKLFDTVFLFFKK